MARGAWRGAAGAWLGLIVLQAVTTRRGAGAVGGLIGTVDGLVKRALDPTVPAIPDHSKPAPAQPAPTTAPPPASAGPNAGPQLSGSSMQQYLAGGIPELPQSTVDAIKQYYGIP